ncbi:MAG: HD domain-containing protein [Peptococcaceae bacterium]|nr:HD domain-containing protein [Peptococcaceae bacterium]
MEQILNPLDLAQKVAVFLGKKLVRMKDEPELARVVSPELVLDFAGFEGKSLEENLLARDFTCNAMAVEINNYLESGLERVVDPALGRGDLAQKRLKAVTNMALSTDPVRILRGLRFKYELDLASDLETVKWMAEAAPLLVQSPPERIWPELLRLMRSEQSWKICEEMFHLGVFQAILPELADLAEVEQNYYHTKNVWLHSLQVYKSMEQILVCNPFSNELKVKVATYLDRQVGPGRVRELVKFAALVHDIGKPETQARRADGRITFHGHDVAGEEKFIGIARRLRLSATETKLIAKLIKLHMRCGFLFKSDQVTDRAVHKLMLSAGEDGIGIILLSLADAMATASEHRDGAIEAGYREFLLELMHRFSFARERYLPPALLNGKEVMQTMGLEPGVQVGLLLEDLMLAQVDGLVKTKDEAIAYLKGGSQR